MEGNVYGKWPTEHTSINPIAFYTSITFDDVDAIN